MKNNKVKYNRKEYREDYLNSPEWKAIKNLVFSKTVICQCCNSKIAKDLHHMVYRNIVDVKITDLLPVCRGCHVLIHKAISDGYIPTDENRIDYITKLTKNIKNDKNYEKLSTWLRTKHHLTDCEIKDIKNADYILIKQVGGLINRRLEFEDLDNILFTGFQIEKIRNFIKIYKYRKNKKQNKKPKTWTRKVIYWKPKI